MTNLTETQTHYYIDALAPIEDWEPQHLQQLKDWEISYQYLTKEKYPNQPDIKFFGSQESLHKLITSIWQTEDEYQMILDTITKI